MNDELGIENGELTRLRAKLARLEKDVQQLEAQLLATRGAVQVVRQLIAEAEAAAASEEE